MAIRGPASSEHLERLHEIFRGLHGELRGVPERLRGGAAGEAGRLRLVAFVGFAEVSAAARGRTAVRWGPAARSGAARAVGLVRPLCRRPGFA